MLYAVGLAAFALTLPVAPDASATADGIVALTGGTERLPRAVALLEQGKGKRLLITGVNPVTQKGELKSLLHGGPAFDCCLDLGFMARDTRGNARETADWARTNGYRSLIVVTARYHLPRSLIELRAQMGDVTLIPYPVELSAPYSRQTLWRIFAEYPKYLASAVLHPAAAIQAES